MASNLIAPVPGPVTGPSYMLARPGWEDHCMSSRRIAVCLEVTPKQALASRADYRSLVA